MSRKIEKKSPLKSAPLRSAGQSIEDHRIRTVLQDVVPDLIGLSALFVLTVMEWQRHFFPREAMPWLFTILTLGLALFTAVRVWRVKQKMEGWKLGRDGERAVGQLLDTLRADGYQVFHDVLGKGFNLDHVLIGPGGVFTVETKTWSKPAKGSPEILFDGEAIRVGGLEPDRNPVIQARAQAGWLAAERAFRIDRA